VIKQYFECNFRSNVRVMHLQIYEAIIDALPVLFFGMGW